MPRRRQTPASYRAAQLEARRIANQLSLQAARQVQRALDQYAAELARRVRTLRDPARLQATIRAVQEGSAALRRRLETLVGQDRVLAFDKVLEAQLAASAIAAEGYGIGITVPSITMLGQFEAVGGAGTWRTLLQGHGIRAAEEATHIIRQGILQQADPAALARALRPYVSGAEEFHKAFGPLAADGIDLRVLRPTDPALRGAARRMNFNARRIAFSELHNARQEAELTAFANDPLVKAIGWRLSTYRGPTARPDECDVLAKTDFYGLGPGVFPITAVPLPPHPFDRCERVPIIMTRQELLAGTPRVMTAPLRKDPGTLRLGPLGIQAAARRRVRANAAQAIAESAGAAARMAQIATSGPVSPVTTALAVEEYAVLHNAAAREYKAAFEKVGAHLWRDDDARALSKSAIASLKTEVIDNPAVFTVLEVARPLTVLDAYPHVTAAQRAWLNAEVDRIAARYRDRFARVRARVSIIGQG